MSSPASSGENAPATSYDEYVSEQRLAAGQRSLQVVKAMAGDTSELEMVLSYAVISAHWLMSETWPDDAGPKCLSAALRERFEVGERPDRDLIDWVVAICGLFIIYATVSSSRRPEFIAGLARATDLTGVLEPEAAEVEGEVGNGRLDLRDPGSSELLRGARHW